jgi:hypothetical protein
LRPSPQAYSKYADGEAGLLADKEARRVKAEARYQQKKAAYDQAIKQPIVPGEPRPKYPKRSPLQDPGISKDGGCMAMVLKVTQWRTVIS